MTADDTIYEAEGYMDEDLHEADIVNFHPLTNTATTALDQAAFRRVLALLEREPIVVDFRALTR